MIPGAGRTVMNGVEEQPLLVLDRKGRGRVALLLSDHAWLWARGYDGGGPHTDLLRRLAHWLMKEPDLEEERLIASSKGLKLTHRAPLDGGERAARCTVSAPGGETSEVTLEPAGPGVWRSTIDVKTPGSLQAADVLAHRPAHRRRPCRHRGRARDERGDGDGREAEAA